MRIVKVGLAGQAAAKIMLRIAAVLVCAGWFGTAVADDSPGLPTPHVISYPAYFNDSGDQLCIDLVSPKAIENLSDTESFCQQDFLNNLPPDSGVTVGSWECFLTDPTNPFCRLPAFNHLGQQFAYVGIKPTCPSEGGGGTLGSSFGDSFGSTYLDDCMNIFVLQHQRDPGCPFCKSGDPINPNSGNHYETVTDYRGAGPFPLVFSRTYNSLLGTGPDFANYATGENLGAGWTNTIGAHLNINPLPVSPVPCVDTVVGSRFYGRSYFCPVSYTDSPVEITVWHADGGQAWFELPSPPATIPAGTVFPNEQGGKGQLTVVNLAAPLTGTGFQYLRNDGYTELYNASGQLLSVTNTYGLTQTYNYTNGQLTSITDPFRRSLTFTYDSSGRVSTMTNPLGGMYTYSYDTSNRLQSVKYPDNSLVQYTYGENSAPGNALTGLIDENGVRYATWGYNAQQQATSSVNAGNVNPVSISYTNDPTTGNVTSAAVTEATGLVRTLTYTNINGQDLVTSESAPCVDCSDKTHTFTYDANGFIASRTDFDGNETQYIHDAFGNETSRTEGITAANPLGERTITTQWDLTLNQPTLITEPGRTTGYAYDTVGHVLTKTVTDTATNVARTTTYTYYTSGIAAGLLYTVTDPLSHVTTYGYDGSGNLASIANALNEPPTKITAYDANGMPLTIIDPNGVETDLTYDARQRLKTRTVAGAETQFAYDAVGNLIQVTLPGTQTCPNTPTVQGTTLQYKYDAAHRLTQVTDCFGNYIQYTLDNLGNRTGETTKDPSNDLTKTLSRTYNSLNQLITLVGGAGQTTHYTPDTLGNVTGITDPRSTVAVPIVTTQTFDSLNRLATVVDPESGNTTYNYDPLDRVQDVTDPKGLNTEYSYDAFGDVTKQVSPDTGTTTYTYDLAGNRLTKTDARGLTATYSYDALNRLTGISYLDASRDVTYTYDQGADGIGHLTGVTDASGTTAYSYDAHGNTTQKVVTMGGHIFTVGYGYDAADNLTSMTYPSGLTVTYIRDAAERVAQVDVNGSPVVSSITYEPFGPIAGLIYGNSLTENRSYDLDYRLTGIDVPGVLVWTLADNADDDITSITDSLNGSNSQTLGYDSLNRLTSASGSYGSLSYAYDIASSLDGYDGNRTSESLNTVPTSFTYDTASNHLLTVGSQTYSYDAVGNLVNDGSHTYNYDVTNRLAGFDATTSAYVYNGLGQRSIKFPNVGADTTPPSVTITAPADGAEVSGIVNIAAAAADNVGVTSVQFFVDGAPRGTSETAAPYSVTWDTTGVNQGSHTLTATALDAAGNSTTSTAVIVYIPDTIPPTVSITAPANGATVSGTAVILSATAADNVSVAGVQFQLDGSDIGSAVTSTPYNLSWDSTTSIGAHTLTAIATDTSGHQTTSTPVSITVQDLAATANGGSLTTNVNVTGNSTLAATQAYPTQTLTFAIVTAPSHGTVTITNAATGAFTYTPGAGYVGTDSFTFTATDSYSTVSNVATESITVSDLTAMAMDGSLTTNVNVAGTGTLAATLAYPTQTLTFTAVTAPVHGTLTITNAATGAFTYTPAANYIGTDSFTFSATDGYGVVTNIATESITVSDVAATAVAGSLTTSVNVAGAGTLAATLDYPTQALTFAVVTAPVHGSVTITNTATGAFTYTPAVNYIGTDSFTFSATDSYGVATNVATESITVSDVAATAVNGSLTTNVNVTANGTLAATMDYSTQTLTYAVAANPSHGSVTVNTSTGAFTYTPNAGYAGADSFTFSATDSYGTASNAATESVTVNDIAPTVNSGSLSTNSGTAVSGNLSTTLGYPTQTLTYAVVAGAVHGSVTITDAATGAFTYTPAAGYVGTDTFSFQVADGYGTSSASTATESVTVLGAVASLGPSTTNFGAQVIAMASGPQTITLTNNGNLLLTGISISVTGTNSADFTYTTTCSSSLTAGSSCAINVTFTPTASGARSASIQVSDSSVAGSTQTASLQGTGQTAIPHYSPSSISFGSVTVGSSSTQTITFTNTGTGTLTITNMVLPTGPTCQGPAPGGGCSRESGPPFTATTTCGSSLAAGAQCTITATFAPYASEPSSYSIKVYDNTTSGSSPQSIGLSGSGSTSCIGIACTR